jgi:hypothetical protein
MSELQPHIDLAMLTDVVRRDQDNPTYEPPAIA